MNKKNVTLDDLQELFEQFLRASDKVKTVEAELDNMPPEPKRPERCTLAELKAYITARDAWRAELVARRERKRTWGTERDAVEKLIRQVLPSGIWVRYNDLALGVACSNGGSTHYYLATAPWSDDLKSDDLDDCHKGD